MKKVLSVLLSLVSVICIACAFTGCSDKDAEENIDENGRFFDLSSAYENDWLDESDLKSIACRYYEWRNFGENPYEGMYNSTEELSKKTESKLLQFFSDDPEVKLLKYFGTYDGNIVVSIGKEFTDDKNIGNDVTIGGIIFADLQRRIIVYRENTKKPQIHVQGKLYKIADAYEEGLIDNDALKSISCSIYERYNERENPYNGLYEKPDGILPKDTKNEIKQAYLEQVDRYPEAPLEGVSIEYIGTYNEKIVVAMSGYNCGYPNGNSEREIGGVTFCNGSQEGIYVYLITEN